MGPLSAPVHFADLSFALNLRTPLLENKIKRGSCVSNSRGQVLIATETLHLVTMTNPYTEDQSQLNSYNIHQQELILPAPFNTPDSNIQFDLISNLEERNLFVIGSRNSLTLMTLNKEGLIRSQDLPSMPQGLTKFKDGRILVIYTDPSVDRTALDLDLDPTQDMFSIESTISKTVSLSRDMAVVSINHPQAQPDEPLYVVFHSENQIEML